MLPFAPARMTAAGRKLVLACAMSAGLASMPSYAVDFTEIGDAGQTQTTAQVGAGAPGALNNIFGSLLSLTDADLYIIDIVNPLKFSATTDNKKTGFLDTQLFLLTLAGAPIFLNDDDAGGLTSSSTLPAGSFSALTAGLYLLGVSVSGYDPININAQALFANGLPTALRGPDTNGLQPAVLGGFADNVFATDVGDYKIHLTGVAAIPEPATNALLLAGGALCAYVVRRRRSAAVNMTA